MKKGKITINNTKKLKLDLNFIDVSDGRTLTINSRHLVFPFFESDNYTLYLPELKSLPGGTIIEIKSIGKGKYKIAQRDNQVIYHNNQRTTEGSKGYLQLRYGGNANWIQLVCINDLVEPQNWYSFGYTDSFDCY